MNFKITGKLDDDFVYFTPVHDGVDLPTEKINTKALKALMDHFAEEPDLNETIIDFDDLKRVCNGWIEHNTKPKKAKDIGIDPRAAYELLIGENFIACPLSSASTLDYYGGFEYHNKEFTQVMGDYKIYLTTYGDGDDRVEDIIDQEITGGQDEDNSSAV